MTDEQTADDIMAMRFTYTADGMHAAIVRALQQARKEGAASVIRPPTVAEPTGILDEDHPCDWCD